MIDRTFSNSLNIADIAPRAATKLPEPSRGGGGFGEALAGAHTVHDRRESHQATTHSRREWARGDHAADRTRGQDRAAEASSRRADDADATTAAPDADAVRKPADAEASQPAAVDAGDAAGEAADPTAPVATDVTAAAEATAHVTVAVAAAPVADLDAIVVPTGTTTTQVASGAVDAAMRLAIDADAAADPALPVDAEVDAAAAIKLAMAAQGSEDAVDGDVEGPTRLATSTPLTTSGPTLGQATTTTVEGEVVATAAKAGMQPVAAAPVQDVATGDVDATAQLLQQAAVEGTGDEAVDAQATARATVAGAVTEEAAEESPVAANANGRINATTHVQNPTAAAQVQANAQAQAKLAGTTEEGGESAAPKLEPLGSSQPVAGGARDAQLSAGIRVREGIIAGSAQDRIDHIADQLATRLRLSHAAGGSQVQLSLKPRELGEVVVQMQVRDGIVAATILVDKADTVRTLQSNIEELKRSLEGQGLSIDEFSVDVRGETGAGGANARAAAEQRQSGGASRPAAADVAGAAAAVPGLSGGREVDADALHDGDISVLA